MPPRANPAEAPVSPGLRGVAIAFGLFLGLGFLKFPNPPILENLISAPDGFWEWMLVGWPVRYAYPLMGVLMVASLGVMRWPQGVSVRDSLLPLAWLGWVAISCVGTIDARLSGLTLAHFGMCVACFYLGLLVWGQFRRPGYLFAGMAVALGLVLVSGWDQHFGGLERTRNYFQIYYDPTRGEIHPDLLKRMQSNRIFATLFYPNSLAGLLLLVVPLALGWIADARQVFSIGARRMLGGLVAAGAAGCMIWSGSKGGWLLAMAGGVAVMARLPWGRRVKAAVLIALIAGGLGGFAVKYLVFFQQGATSVGARFDYWSAAARNIGAHPVFGSGPGTFVTVYRQLKPPDAEMARLVHNDYLQQASDSGVIAGLLFVSFVGWVIWRGRVFWKGAGWTEFGVALGVALFALQSTMEFGFYVPATAWGWFALAGWLVARGGLGFDNRLQPA